MNVSGGEDRGRWMETNLGLLSDSVNWPKQDTGLGPSCLICTNQNPLLGLVVVVGVNEVKLVAPEPRNQPKASCREGSQCVANNRHFVKEIRTIGNRVYWE